MKTSQMRKIITNSHQHSRYTSLWKLHIWWYEWTLEDTTSPDIPHSDCPCKHTLFLFCWGHTELNSIQHCSLGYEEIEIKPWKDNLRDQSQKLQTNGYCIQHPDPIFIVKLSAQLPAHSLQLTAPQESPCSESFLAQGQGQASSHTGLYSMTDVEETMKVCSSQLNLGQLQRVCLAPRLPIG